MSYSAIEFSLEATGTPKLFSVAEGVKLARSPAVFRTERFEFQLSQFLLLSGEMAERFPESLRSTYEWCRLKLKTGRISMGFLLEAAAFDAARIFSSFAFTDAIGDLESNAPSKMMKAASPFKGKVLSNLWHVHFFDAKFIPTNLRNEVTDERMQRLCEPHYGKYVEEFADQLIHELVMGSYEDRARRSAMTGEWIVFSVKNGRNCYETIGFHKEGDDNIALRVREHRELERLLAQNYRKSED